MARQIYFLVLFLICASCTDNVAPKAPDQVTINPESHTGGRYHHLLSKYENITIDTLEVHYTSGDENGSKFYGTPLSYSEVELLPAKLRSVDTSEHFYACYKFEIDSMTQGLITRTPSMYESSSVQLLVYDERLDSIVYHFEIAEEWGDAGEAFIKTSWIFTRENMPFVLTEENYSVDNSINGDSDTTVEETTTTYLLKLDKFRFDTVSKNDSLFRRKFTRRSH